MNLVNKISKYKAFTLNELLIAIVIIGIIASITIPPLMEDTSKKHDKVASDKIQIAITNVLKSMRLESNLTGNETTENFVNELQEHMNIRKICGSNELSNCFVEHFWVSEDYKNLSAYTSSSAFGKDWGTNINGVILSDGTRMLIAYNPNCSKFEPENCVSIFYDTNKTNKKKKYTGINGATSMGVYNAELE